LKIIALSVQLCRLIVIQALGKQTSQAVYRLRVKMSLSHLSLSGSGNQ
jgi:hypothetical protein